MLTYRVKKVADGSMILEFECYAFEDRLDGEEKDLILASQPGFFENDWVALKDGKLVHINEEINHNLVEKMSDAREAAFEDPSKFKDFLDAKAAWEYYLSHPEFIEDEEAYYKKRTSY